MPHQADLEQVLWWMPFQTQRSSFQARFWAYDQHPIGYRHYITDTLNLTNSRYYYLITLNLTHSRYYYLITLNLTHSRYYYLITLNLTHSRYYYLITLNLLAHTHYYHLISPLHMSTYFNTFHNRIAMVSLDSMFLRLTRCWLVVFVTTLNKCKDFKDMI